MGAVHQRLVILSCSTLSPSPVWEREIYLKLNDHEVPGNDHFPLVCFAGFSNQIAIGEPSRGIVNQVQLADFGFSGDLPRLLCRGMSIKSASGLMDENIYSIRETNSLFARLGIA